MSDPNIISDQSYLHTRESGARLPLEQSLATGAFVAVLAAIPMIRAGWKFIDVLTGVIIAFVVPALIVWLYLLYRWISLTVLERAVGIDINGDGRIGDEVIIPVRVDTTETKSGYTQVERASFANGRKLAAVARAVVAGAPFSQREMVDNRKLLSRGEFDEMKDEMLERGIIIYRNPEYPKLGFEMTRAGGAVMRNMADTTLP